MAASGSGYPVTVRIDGDQHLNQLWGIPIVGVAIRGLILLPHLIVLWGFVTDRYPPFSLSDWGPRRRAR